MIRLTRPVHHRLAVFFHDLAMVPVAWFGAYWLRAAIGQFSNQFWRQALLLFPVVILCQAVAFWYVGLYRGVWRFASIPDLLRILKAAALGVVTTALALFLLTRLNGIPRSVLVIDGILLLLLLGGPRLVYRVVKDRQLYRLDRRRALIVGATPSGEALVRDMLRDSGSPYRPVGFIDDDRRRWGREIHGLPILGACEQLGEFARRLDVDLAILALTSSTAAEFRRIVQYCELANLPVLSLPRMHSADTGEVSITALRNVGIEDLLGREAVTLDRSGIAQTLAGKSVLVTGAGGSIGAELCRQIARFDPARLVAFERSEYGLYQLSIELRREFPGLTLVSELGDVGDVSALRRVFRVNSPDVVFHTAAYKHVPMLESQVRAAVLNNVFGTRNVACLAAEQGCTSFVLVSSDKAVNPTNVMGATKRAAEMLCQHTAQSANTRFVTVRFGNVLGSSGSVVPLFREQIARGGPVTVTHPDVTRFFMTIPEAGQLILQANAMARNHEVFVLDMGEPISIAYLAEQLIRLSGRDSEQKIEIVYTGLRPGEKMHEELFYGAECLIDTPHPKILLARAAQTATTGVQQGLDALERACADGDENSIRMALARWVPEFQPSSAESETSHEVDASPGIEKFANWRVDSRLL